MNRYARPVVCLFALTLGASLSRAQFAQPVNQSAGPPPWGVQVIFDYAGGPNLVYTGYAMSDQGRSSTVTVTAASNASPVSFSAASHGFNYASGATATPTVCISGATGNWTPINGCFAATPTSANAFTIPVDSTTFGALTGTLVVTTRAPRTSQAVWSISKDVYDNTNKLIWSGWASTPGGAGSSTPSAGNTALNNIFDNRATLSYQ